MTASCPGESGSLIAQADLAMARGDVRAAASLLEVAAQRGRDSTTLLRLATVRRSIGDLSGALRAATAGVELSPRNFLMCLLLGSLREGARLAFQSLQPQTPQRPRILLGEQSNFRHVLHAKTNLWITDS